MANRYPLIVDSSSQQIKEFPSGDTLLIDAVNIDGGTIDGVTIGGSSAGAGSFTTLNTSGSVVFNEAGADVDFRVESDSNSHMLFVDSGNNRVGVATSTPGSALQVGDATYNDGTITVVDSIGFNSSSNLNPSLNRWALRARAGGVEGDFDIYNAKNSIAAMTFGESEVVANEDSANVDFRVESDSNTHALFVDAGNDRVHVASSGSGPSNFNVANNMAITNAGGAQYLLMGNQDSAGASNPSMIVAANGALLFGNGDSWSDASGGTFSQRFKIASGEITVNENSYDQDFRVESDSNTHALFVDASGTGLAVNDSSTSATGFDTTLKLGGSINGGGLVAYVEENNVANGSYVDINVGNSSINYWTGMLGVSCSSVANGANRTQSMISILANNQFPGFNTSVLHTADGTAARSFTVTYVATGTIRITNTSGDTCFISAWFTGGGSQF